MRVASLKTLIALALRIVLAGTFLYAGVSKLLDTRGLALDMTNYRLISPAVLGPLAAALPGIEIVAGVCLLIPKTATAASLLVTFLLAVFTAAVAQALARGINLDCGCFGAAKSPVTMFTLLRDVLLLVLSCSSLLLAWRRPVQNLPQGVKP